MSRVSWLVLTCLMCFAVSVSADSEPIYKLYVPTAEEHLSALPSILDQAKQNYPEPSTDNPYYSLVNLTWTEINNQYQPFSDHSYDILASLHPYYASPYEERLSRDLVMAWLRENPVNLDDYDSDHPLTFGEFVIKVTQYDFDIDGQHEWALDISQGTQYRWREVLKSVSPGHYQRIETPLSIFNSAASYTRASIDEVLAFEDLNQDGLPEWVIALGGGGGNPDFGYLVILQWQDGQIVDLVPDRLILYTALGAGGPLVFPYGVTVELKDVNHNGTTDIQVVQKEQYDNLGCTWTQIRNYGWQEQRYSLINENRQYDDTAACAWRAAEADMWENNYESAIANYARAFSLPVTEGTRGYFNHELWEYEYVRWVLAYALTDQPIEAQQILDNLYAVGIQSGAVQQMYEILRRMIEERAAAEDICQALYSLWQGHLDTRDQLFEKAQALYLNEPIYINYRDVIDLDAYVGYIEENYISNYHGLAFPSPEKAGCDINSSFTMPPERMPDVSVEKFLPYQSVSSYHPPVSASASAVFNAFYHNQTHQLLISARFELMRIQQGILEGNEWQARYLFATALRQNNRLDEALEQYIYIYENSPLASWRQLAGLYLKPIGE